MRAQLITVMATMLALTACYNAGEGEAEWNSATLGDSHLSDFYELEDNPTGAPGELLRQETPGEKQSIEAASTNVRLLYTSTEGLRGEDTIAVSGVLFLPEGTPPEGGWPLMAWTHGTVGIADICAPSWNGRQQQDVDYLTFWLNNGYAVVASDYQGLGMEGTHPYLATRPAAFSNLDIIRAVQQADFPVADEVVLIGQSQGAGAAVASAAYAPDYAPELDIRGVVATGVPYFSPAALVALNKSRPQDKPDPFLGYNFLAMTLAEQIVPGFVMREHVSDEVWPIASMVTSACHKDVRARVVEEELTYQQTFTKNPTEALEEAFGQMGFPRLDFSVPIFLGTGALDRDTPQRMQAAFMRDACAAGSRIEAHLYPDLAHREVVPGSTGESLPFVKAAFGGEEINGNCADAPLE